MFFCRDVSLLCHLADAGILDGFFHFLHLYVGRFVHDSGRPADHPKNVRSIRGPIMAIPVNPEPGRSSVHRHQTAGSPSVSPPTVSLPAPIPGNTPSPTTPPLSLPVASDDSSPTVISSNRHKGTSVDVAHAESLTGRRLGNYELIESIGVGGMAAVIKAHDVDLGRVVALKILPPDMAIDPENITRFKQEARAAARLDHENVARVYNCGEDQGLHFIAFEFVEGEDLRARMTRFGGSLPVAESVHYLMQVAAGLSHAASRSVVHRDIKPSNIVITPEGKAKIVDMGLARNLDPRTSNGQLTQSGVTLGTFDYISPEQAIEPRSADIRSDIYSLGCTFYHVLTGHPPVPDGTAAKKLHCQQHVAPLDPRNFNSAIPDELAAILGRMMQKDPAKRYQHPDHLLVHLLSLAEKLKLPSRPAVSESALNQLRYDDKPLPLPPRWSPLWIGIAAVGLALGLYAISGLNSKDPLEPRRLWDNEKPPHRPSTGLANAPPSNNVIAPKDIGNPTQLPREAKTVAELVQYLKDSVPHIKLTPGATYDLTRLGKKDAFTCVKVFLDCERTREPATIRINMTALDDETMVRPGSFSLRGMEGVACEARFRGIRFQFIEPADCEPSFCGINAIGLDKVEFDECWFVPVHNKPSQPGPADLYFDTRPKSTAAVTDVQFRHCYFAPGWLPSGSMAGWMSKPPNSHLRRKRPSSRYNLPTANPHR